MGGWISEVLDKGIWISEGPLYSLHITIPGVEEDDFIWGGGGTKEIVDRLHGHGKGEGTGVPFRAKQLFQTLWLNISRVNSPKKF